MILRDDDNSPGLIQDLGGYVYLVKPDGSRCLLDCGGGGGAPTGPAGGVLAGTYPNPDLNPAIAGAGLDFLANVLSVVTDGTTITVNSANELEVLTGSLTDAVILNPLTSIRNRINPTNDVIPLLVFGSAGQTADLLDVGVEPAVPFFRLSAGKAVGLGEGTFNPSAYGGYITSYVSSHASDGYYDASGGPNYTPSGTQQVVASFYDSVVTPTADGIANFTIHTGKLDSVRYRGSKSSYGLIVADHYALFFGTKAAGSGNQLQFMQAGFSVAETDPSSTGDIAQIAGYLNAATHYGAGKVKSIFGSQSSAAVYSTATMAAAGRISAYDGIVAVGAASGVAIPEITMLTSTFFYSGRTVTLAKGLDIKNVGHSSVATSYAILIAAQSGATDTWAIRSLGGKSRLEAGAATTIPLTLGGAAAQSARLFITEDSAGNNLAAIDQTGKIQFGTTFDTNVYRSAADTLKTDDSLIVALGLSQLGTTLGLLGAAPVAQQAASTLAALWTALKNYGLLTAGSTAPAAGTGTVTSVTATDASIVVTGTATDPTIATGTLNAIATAHPPTANVAMNGVKITGLADGSAPSDAATFGQISAPVSAPDRLFQSRYVCKR